jgi:hypothetical protein
MEEMGAGQPFHRAGEVLLKAIPHTVTGVYVCSILAFPVDPALPFRCRRAHLVFVRVVAALNSPKNLLYLRPMCCNLSGDVLGFNVSKFRIVARMGAFPRDFCRAVFSLLSPGVQRGADGLSSDSATGITSG